MQKLYRDAGRRQKKYTYFACLCLTQSSRPPLRAGCNSRRKSRVLSVAGRVVYIPLLVPLYIFIILGKYLIVIAQAVDERRRSSISTNNCPMFIQQRHLGQQQKQQQRQPQHLRVYTPLHTPTTD